MSDQLRLFTTAGIMDSDPFGGYENIDDTYYYWNQSERPSELHPKQSSLFLGSLAFNGNPILEAPLEEAPSNVIFLPRDNVIELRPTEAA